MYAIFDYVNTLIIRRMKKLKFNKEGKEWYIDLPEWTGDKLDLLMVAGADKMLDILSENKNSVTLSVSEEEQIESGFEKIEKLMETPLTGGATYTSKYFPIWLCDVVRFVYDGRMPDVLYYKVAE